MSESGQIIVANSRAYHELSTTYFYESEYEDIIMSNSHMLFPDGVLCKFKKIINSEYGTVIPDLAYIDKRLAKWAVIEVELSHHSLAGHVLPQIECLLNGLYDNDVAMYLSSMNPSFSTELIKDLVKGEPPEIHVIRTYLKFDK